MIKYDLAYHTLTHSKGMVCVCVCAYIPLSSCCCSSATLKARKWFWGHLSSIWHACWIASEACGDIAYTMYGRLSVGGGSSKACLVVLL